MTWQSGPQRVCKVGHTVSECPFIPPAFFLPLSLPPSPEDAENHETRCKPRNVKPMSSGQNYAVSLFFLLSIQLLCNELFPFPQRTCLPHSTMKDEKPRCCSSRHQHKHSAAFSPNGTCSISLSFSKVPFTQLSSGRRGCKKLKNFSSEHISIFF